MAKLPLTSQVIKGAGATTVQVAVPRDDSRKYFACYAQADTCNISIGEAPHSNVKIPLATGIWFEDSGAVTSKIKFSGTTDARLVVVQDINSKVVLTYDGGIILTKDGELLTYQVGKSPILPPVFK